MNSLEFTWDGDSFCFTASATGCVSRTERSSFVSRTTIFERQAFSQTDGQRVALETDKAGPVFASRLSGHKLKHRT